MSLSWQILPSFRNTYLLYLLSRLALASLFVMPFPHLHFFFILALTFYSQALFCSGRFSIDSFPEK